jgi:hypothetical protein
MSPHLFTHLFHEGVIVSSRKLVYDASASEDAIKSLMQAQHKAVLKDLKIHTFDDKIDAYLGGTPGLEPRGAEIVIERSGTEPGEPPLESVEVAPPAPEVKRAKRKSTVPPPKQVSGEAAVPNGGAESIASVALPGDAPNGGAESIELLAETSPAKPRTKTAERTSRSSQFRSIPPPEATPDPIDAGLTIPTEVPVRPTPPPPIRGRAATPPPPSNITTKRLRSAFTWNLPSSAASSIRRASRPARWSAPASRLP